MAAREPFAKMAAALDSNRKIRRGGRDAREVYLWVLRQVAQRDSDGEIPLADVTDYEHVSGQLMCSEAEVREGFERAVTVALLSVTDDRCSVVGWNEEWGRRAMTGAERVAKHRSRHGKDEKSTGADVTKRYSVTGAVSCNAGEERRGEEKRGERERGPAAPAALVLVPSEPAHDPAKDAASALVARINLRTGRHFSPASAETLKNCRANAKAGIVLADQLAAIDAKCDEWGADQRMSKHLTPSTLLRPSNMARYVDETKAGPARSIAAPVRGQVHVSPTAVYADGDQIL